MSNVNTTTFTIVVALFVIVTGAGFAAARWRRATDMMQLDEWGLGGRGFGTFITWFLLGGDLYTAYTFIAVPALVFGSGSIGFYAVSYTIMVFPIVLIFLPRLWSVSRVHGYVTPADFIRGRYGSRGLALAAAFTGILALMPYIALQLVGIKAVITVMGVNTSSTNTYLKDLPLFIAFLVLAIFTYYPACVPRPDRLHQGLADLPFRHRGGLLHPHQAGRLEPHLRHGADALQLDQPDDTQADRHVCPDVACDRQHAARLRVARPRLRGRAVPLPARDHRHAGGQAPQRGQAQHDLPAAVLGTARADRAVRVHGGRRPGDGGERQEGGQRTARGAISVPAHVPELVHRDRVRRIIIGALVPAAIMAIAAANLFTSNIFKEFFKQDATPRLADADVSVGVAGGQARRAAVRGRTAADVLDQPAAARRRVDPADLARC